MCMIDKIIKHVPIDNGTVVNIMLATIMRKIGKSKDDLVMANKAVTNFAGDSYKPKRVLLVHVEIGSKVSITISL